MGRFYCQWVNPDSLFQNKQKNLVFMPLRMADPGDHFELN